jgi:hypothetical protein
VQGPEFNTYYHQKKEGGKEEREDVWVAGRKGGKEERRKEICQCLVKTEKSENT